MEIREILLDILSNYGNEKKQKIAENEFVKKVETDYTDQIFKIAVSKYGERYLVDASCGTGQWAHCPWIAIFDTLVTSSAQSGYYIVYLFNKDMDCVYLSLNQGVTSLRNHYKKDTDNVLLRRAGNFRCQLTLTEDSNQYIFDELALNEASNLPKSYNKGNIIAKRYSIDKLPNEDELLKDLDIFINYYQQLVASDSGEELYIGLQDCKSVKENKALKLHYRFDRRGDVSNKVKKTQRIYV